MLFAQFDFPSFDFPSVDLSGLEDLFSLLLIGGVLALLVPVLLLVFLRKKRRRGAPQSADAKQAASGPPPVTPSTDVQQLDNRITPVKLHCPQCNQLLEVAESMSGQVITCPACSGDLRIPAMVENEPTRQESRPAPHQEAITKSRNRDAGRQYWSKAFKAQFFISIGLFVCACILPVDNEMTGFTCLWLGVLMPHMWAPNPIYLTAIVLAIKHRYLGAAIVGSIATLWAICVVNVSCDFSGAPPFWCASMLVLTVGCFIQWRKECDDDGLTDADELTAGTDPTNADSFSAPGMSADELRLAKEKRRARNKKILKWGLPTVAIISLLVLITNYWGPLEYKVEDGVVTIIGCEENLEGELTIPATIRGKPVTCIENDTFRDCSRLTAIIIPDSVTRIGGSAFYRCSNLASVTIGNGVTSITGNLFKEHANLKSVTIPDSVTSIGNYAFQDCTNLTSITLPNSVTSIGENAFNGCSSLTSITIPDSVTSIGDLAFNSCSNLTSITFPDSVTSIGESAFRGCHNLTSITIGNGVTSIGPNAFQGCSSLTAVTFLGDAPKGEKDIFKGSTPIIYRKPGAKGWSRSWSARLVERIAIQGGANINGLDESVGEVDFDNPETRKKIVADAIYRTQSEWRGDEGEERLYFRDYQMPYSGWWKEMRGKGNGYHIASLVQYKDGKRDGPMANWYKNGKKRLEHIYKDGKKHGLSRGWYNNGKKWWEETCKDGNWDGLRTAWYDNGLKKFENTYKDGKLHGLSRGWYRNGNKRRERTYKDGELMSIVDWKPDGEKFSGSKLVSIFKTGNVKNAGSDGLVMHAHIIGLDESRSSLGRLDNIDVNDREAGSTDVYSLPFNYPVAEIQGVELVVVKGNDGWRAETISFQFYDGGKKSKPYAFEVNQWFSADKKDLDSIGAIKSRMFSFQPAFEANQSPVP
jgi:antitoxin component YwqK of YwqJK toxin-antitoxin module